MRIIILDEEKITKLLLPSVVSGAYIFQPGDDKNVVMNIEAEEDNWIAKSNGSINICDEGQIIPKIVVRDYHYYNLQVANKDYNYIMFCMPTLDNTFKKYNISGDKITIGKDPVNPICITVEFLENKQIIIEKKDNEWQIEVPEKLMIYLNEKRIRKSKLKVGDSIFIYGTVLIWLGDYIQINNPRNIVKLNNLFTPYLETNVDNSEYSPATDAENEMELYTKDDYFFHKPRLIQTVEKEKVQIDAPPETQIKEELPWILAMGTSFTMLAFSSITIINLINNINNGSAKPVTIVTSLIMCGSMMCASLLFPNLTRSYNKKKAKKNEKKRIEKYSQYLDTKEQEINVIMDKQSQILRASNLSYEECYNFALSGQRDIWTRDVQDDDFLEVRLGVGNKKTDIDISAPEEHFTLVEDELKNAVYNIVNKSRMLHDIPITFKFTEHILSAIIGGEEVTTGLLNSILLQLSTLQSPNELKIVGLFNKNNSIIYNYLKYIPHNYSADKDTRFFAENTNEAKSILSYLKKIYDERKSTDSQSNDNKSDSYKQYSTYYLILCDNYTNVRDVQLIDEIIKSQTNYGFSIVFLDRTMQRLPKKCESIITLDAESGAVIIKNLNDQQQFKPEFNNNLDMRKIGTLFMPIPIMNTDFSTYLPQSISFLDMYNVSKIEQLNVLSNWKNNNPVSSLQAAVGVHSDGDTFYLDLHEKKHGPHGLIAGSTGSGKSEFIITYILSMCINYHPDEVQFILIDYKGGGLAGAFYNEKTGIKVPHIAGVLTDLDTSNMNRAIVSINSELKRREHAFNEAKAITGESTIDIYKYQKYYREGILKEPISHLFIVSDEFAELKSQQPDFMANIISISRIGRSLGVHLILATQKPSGVVNDQIWSNSRFKICLKVATRSDSMEMLKRPEAASLKEAGRFYLQVGYDELFEIGQSGWSGARYVPNDRIIKKRDESITFIDNIGNSYKSVNDLVSVTPTKEYGDQLTNCVKHLTAISDKLNYKIKKLWLDTIPPEIYLSNIKEKYKTHKVIPYSPNPIIGEYDHPAIQKQNLLELNLLSKNTMIFGNNNSGLDDILKTIIFSTCLDHSPEEVNFYIVDMGAKSLRIFNKYPQVGDICTIEDGDKILNMLIIGENEMERRKDLFADYSGDYKTYIEQSGEKLPLIIYVINYLDIFTENFAKIADALGTIYRDGPKYGIEFIITGSANSMRARTAELFENKIALQLPDKDQYRNILGSPRGLVPANYLGRGLINLPQGSLEFQTAFISQKTDTNETIKKVAALINEKYQTKAPNVPVIPKIVALNSVINSVKSLNGLVIGYDLDTKREFEFDVLSEKITPILTADLNAEINFVYSMIEEIKTLKNVKLQIIDANNYIDFNKLQLVELHNQNFDDVMNKIYQEVTHPYQNTINLYLITGISELKEKLNANSLKLFNSLMTYVQKLTNSYFIIADTYENYKNIQVENWYSTAVNEKHGIWLGAGINQQIALSFNKLSYEQKQMNFPDIAFATVKGKNYVIKKVILTDEEEETNGQ